MDKEEYISYKSNKVKTNNYRALKYGVVYADFILEDIANTILNEHKELDFVMVVRLYFWGLMMKPNFSH